MGLGLGLHLIKQSISKWLKKKSPFITPEERAKKLAQEFIDIEQGVAVGSTQNN